MNAAPLRYAILHDDALFEDWQRRCLGELGALPDTRAELLITRRSAVPDLPGSLARAARILLPRAAADEGQSQRAFLTRLKSCNLDFVLSFVAIPWPPEMLDVPRYGVWHFQFGDWTHYRGGPAGFWEVYDGASVSGALLTRVLPRSDSFSALKPSRPPAIATTCARA
jgi:hypothetical protein